VSWHGYLKKIKNNLKETANDGTKNDSKRSQYISDNKKEQKNYFMLSF
jgi:hypothetical protein